MRLFNEEKVNKFFDLLSTKKRYISKENALYEHDCEKVVFVRRALSKLKDKSLIYYNTTDLIKELNYKYFINLKEKDIIIPCKRYFTISDVKYYLDYGEELEITYFDWLNYPLGSKTIVVNKSDIKNIEGLFTEDLFFIETIKHLTKLDLQEKEFIFKAYDWDKYPKRVKKGTDVMSKILIPITVKAQTLNLAHLEINKLKNKESKIQYTLELWNQ